MPRPTHNTDISLAACRLWLVGLGVVVGLIQPAISAELPSLPGLTAEKAMTTRSDKPEVEVELLADLTAVSPGGMVELAVRFTIPDGWHIYWKNRGEGGLETRFDWKLPPGYAVGEMRFPPPTRHVDEGDAHTFILEGEATVLTTLTAPSDAKPGDKAAIGVDVDWLVCRKLCYPGDKSLSLELPIVASADAAEPADEEDIAYARKQLPLAAGKAKYLQNLRAVASVDKVKPGQAFKLAVVFEVQDGFHINSHEPLQEGLIPTDVFHERAEGVEIGRAEFPPGKVEDSHGDKLSLYRGKTAVVLPVQPDGDLARKELRFNGVITYQACNDESGTCFPPTAAEWSATVSVAAAGESVSAANAELFGNTPAVQPAQTGSPETPAPAPDAQTSDGRNWLQRTQDRLAGLGVLGYLLLAAVGGFLLNLMPCVLPVISIKILSFVQQARESRLRIFTLGSAFAGGIFLSFLVLGALIVGAGQQWGGLFQRPWVVIFIASVVTAFALSLFGVFSLFPPRVVNELGEQVQGEGHLSAFGMGLLATFLGTACTAPFLSFVIAIAIQQTVLVGMLIFATAGFGMAFPYVLLAAQPSWVRIIPRPGPWMGTFERIVGFLLLGTVVWLLSPLATQLGGQGVVFTLGFLLCVAAAAAVYGKVQYGASFARKLRYYGFAALLIVGGWLVFFRAFANIADLQAAQRALRLGTYDASKAPGWTGADIPWVEYTRERAASAVESGKTVFIDYTADWCVNCKANEKLVLNTQPVRETMQKLGVVPFRADYTSYDKQIAEDLERHGRSGVPMYVVIPAGRPDAAVVLPEILTQSVVVDALTQAGASNPVARKE